MNLTRALYDYLIDDDELVAMLGTYKDTPAIFTSDPAPGNTPTPYIVMAGHAVDVAFDTKTLFGREITRDVRCYTSATGSAEVVELIAERVRRLLHRQPLLVDDYEWILSDVSGPLVADEKDYQARVLSLRIIYMEVV